MGDAAEGPAELVDALEVTVDAVDVDVVSGLLWGCGIAALAEHPLDDTTVLLRTDVPAVGVDAVRATIGPLASNIHVVRVDSGLDAWRAHAEVVRVGERVVVRPPWLPLPELRHDDVVVELDPGHSWGHGAHPTSRMCLAEVERIVSAAPGCGVIDVGCGSGVLAVAAAMLGAGWVEACDLDPAACRATTENAERNGVADIVRVHRVDVEAAADPVAMIDRQAGLVVANIGAATLVEVAPNLSARLAEGGTLVLSGLLDPAPPEVVTAFTPLRLVRSVTLDGWVALTLT
ncbi:MAG: 50S ribosomal protein L11 methyltransferase [Acidimicrobiales bacterium]